MSINHFSSDLPKPLWWAKHHHPIMDPNNSSTTSSSTPHNTKPTSSSWPSSFLHHHRNHPMFSTHNNPTLSVNLNQNKDQELLHFPNQEPLQEQELGLVHHQEKEPMFEKPLTPSDVGKLNRLVIPKQHAEKYFPLSGDSVDKGLLLSFEDELGKYWRFRYSYWNSSQSYVLTKGWSRYVKEKQLDAGDVVLFERHRSDGERLFIGWRRGGGDNNSMVQGNRGGVWSRGLSYASSSGHHQSYQHGHGANVTSTVPYQPDCLHAGSGSGQNQTIQIGNSKRLRLFGVNLECQLDESEPSTPDGSSMSSQGPIQLQLYSFHNSGYSSSSNSSHSNMDITISRDVNQIRNRRR